MTREEIEKIGAVGPYCFKTDREKRWYEIGCIQGLAAADEEPNLEHLWHDAKEEPKENFKIALVDTEGRWIIVEYDVSGSWKFCIEYFNLKIWAYIDDLLPKEYKK